MKKLLLSIVSAAVVLPAYPVAGFREMQNNIGISAVACGQDEVLVNAGGWKFKTSDFIKKGFQPVRIQVSNQSDQMVSISDSSVHFDNSDMRALTDQFKCRENLRPLAFYLIADAICFTGEVIGFGGAFVLSSKSSHRHTKAVKEFLALGLGSLACMLVCLVRAPFYRMNLREANKKLHGIVMDALHAGHIIIPSHQNAEKIILVPVGCARIFSFDVVNEESGATAAKFYVDVR